uniref:Uncharacterized protein n=1 Tax=Anguilla anguilla TaxID=7936 RepID=A0A0E9W1L0_ANGAN
MRSAVRDDICPDVVPFQHHRTSPPVRKHK